MWNLIVINIVLYAVVKFNAIGYRLGISTVKLLELGCVASAGNPCYEKAAVEALSQLWGMRSPLDLVGSSIDMTTGSWNNRLGGTGAGADSFYEYLLKAYVLFGKSDTDCLL